MKSNAVADHGLLGQVLPRCQPACASHRGGVVWLLQVFLLLLLRKKIATALREPRSGLQAHAKSHLKFDGARQASRYLLQLGHEAADQEALPALVAA